jgi:NADH dehydrogenase [ubiquinone] 1 alpha subcomplex assembly factor 1
LTNTGEIVDHQITMYRERVRSFGVSLLGGNSGVEGPYELGIDSIRAVNEEDAVVPGENSSSSAMTPADRPSRKGSFRGY